MKRSYIILVVLFLATCLTIAYGAAQVKQVPMTFTVNSAADTDDGVCDSGNCTLREAITAANSNPGVDTIEFNLGGQATPTITVASLSLPIITDAVIINGNTGGATRVELNGVNTAAGVVGLRVFANNSTIRSLVINRFGGSGIELVGGGNVIEGCYIGTNAAGASAMGNGENGVLINNSSNNRIGGTASAARNVLSGNVVHGLLILGSSSTNNLVQGNYIGTNAAGTAAIANLSEGVSITSSPGNTIGGVQAGAGNLISGNRGKGVRITDIPSTGNALQGNLIGTDSTGLSPIPNISDGVDIFDASNNFIGGLVAGARNVISGNTAHGVRINLGSGNKVQGNYIGTQIDGRSPLGNREMGVSIGNNSAANLVGGDAAGEGNTIAFSGGAGVSILSGSGQLIKSNSIFLNGGLGIDLGAAGVTPNDPGDSDTGPNTLLNFPILTSASGAGGGGSSISGTLNSAPSSVFTLQFFYGTLCDGPGNGEGQVLLGTATVTTNTSGNASFVVTSATSVPHGQFVTATTIDSQNNTSEFSPCVQFTGVADLSITNAASSGSAAAGSNISYNITVTNNGPNPATGAAVTNNLPGSLSFVSCASNSDGVCGGSGNNRTVTFASLQPGVTANITITAKVNCDVANGSQVTSTATASSSLNDPSPGNNSASASFTASNPPPVIAPVSNSVPGAGGSGTVNLTINAGCSWIATTNARWLTIDSGSAGTGSGSVAYTAAENSDPTPRSGTLTIAGLTFTVNQAAGGCTYSITPRTKAFNAVGGTGTIALATAAGCTWAAVSNDGWINITSGGSGTGSGSIAYTVGQNNSEKIRVGRITVAGRTHTVYQRGTGSGACASRIAPTSQSFGVGGGTGSVTIRAQEGCIWSASVVGDASWITITSDTDGVGLQTLTYSVSPNATGAARKGAININGQLLAVKQKGL